MTHGGQELSFGDIGVLGQLAGVAQGSLFGFLSGDVNNGAQSRGLSAVMQADGMDTYTAPILQGNVGACAGLMLTG